MTKKNFVASFHRRAAIVACLFSVAAILLIAVVANAQRPTAKPPRTAPASAVKGTCDDLATHPEDKGRKGAGISDEKIAPGPAIEKCLLAIKQSPGVARFHFQLGRAYWAAKKYDEALEAFLKAEEMNYAPAYFYLAQAYEQGLAESGKPDAATARDLYLLAASGGFEPAARAYGEFEETYEIEFDDFAVPGYVKALYYGEMAELDGKPVNALDLLNKERREVLIYMEGLHMFLYYRRTESIDPSCGKLYDRGAYDTINNIRDQEDSDASGRQRVMMGDSQIREMAEADIHRLVVEYGGCQGAVVTQFYANVKKYLRENPASPKRR